MDNLYAATLLLISNFPEIFAPLFTLEAKTRKIDENKYQKVRADNKSIGILHFNTDLS